ncbi:hypothetical protein GCM10009630_00560 [Kribbella jejuensis]
MLLADCVVGAAGAADGEISIRFSLSVKDVVVGVTVRAQPSGTFTVKPWPWNATNAWLSGMSPGGFDSVATGVDGWTADRLVAGAVVDGAAVGVLDGWFDDAAGDPAEPDEPPPPQEVMSTAVLRESVTTGQSFMDRPQESGNRLHRP